MAEQDPGTSSRSEDEEDSINVRFQFGSVVVAKLGSFPWWPAMIDPSPETGDIYWLDNFEDLSKKNASHYHVVFFDVTGKVTRSWIHSSKIRHYHQHFPELLTEQEREAVKNLKESTSKRRLVEARSTAEAALRVPIEERRKKYSFIYTFKGKITLFDDYGNKKVIEGGGVGEAEKVEPPRMRKKPGPKPKNKTPAGTTDKVEPIKMRKKPGPKPKIRSQPESENGQSQTGVKRSSIASSGPTLPPADKVEPIRIRKKPGRKPKIRSVPESENGQSETGMRRCSSIESSGPSLPPADKVEPIRIRKKPGPKPKIRSPPESENGQSETGMRRCSSIESSGPSLPPESDQSQTGVSWSFVESSASNLHSEDSQSQTGVRRSSVASSTSTLPPGNGKSQTKSRKRRSSSIASSTASLLPDTDFSTPRKPRRTQGSYLTVAASPPSSIPSSDTDVSTPRKARRTLASPTSPPSSKPASAPRATYELAQELSVFAASYPVNESSSRPSPEDMPRRKGKKKKKKSAKGQSQPGKKRGRTSKTPPAPEFVSIRDTQTPTASDDTSARVCSPVPHIRSNSTRLLQVVDKPSATVSLSLSPKELNTTIEKETEPKRLVLADLGHSEPSENSLENQMTSFLNRIQNQTPKLKCNGKTISNLNHLVAKTEEGDIIDLTGDDLTIRGEESIDLTGNDDLACQWRHGEVVFANLKGLQPWPAVIVMDPEINVCFIPKTGQPTCVHVFFFHLNRRAWVPIENVSVFEDNKYYPEEAAIINYEKYLKALTLAQQAYSFPREQRRRQFANMRDVPMTGAPVVPKVPDESIVIL